jgi:tetratricopeptide (TPR) repeat protein
MGGLGKSTLALATAQAARQRGWQVWWVTSADRASVTGGMLEVLRQLRAPETVAEAVRAGAPASADIAWQFLNGPHASGRRWLLIFDNADDPAVLAGHGSAVPGDYTGWLRPDPAGMVIVTTRHRDARTWGRGIVLLDLVPLDDGNAARVLADLAPGVLDPGGRQALELGRRLGGLPLALHLAGSYLGSPFARWHTFADYRMALDSVELPTALADLDDMADQARATIQATWDVSLDALAAGGLPGARQVLLLLSCYAPATPVVASLLLHEPEKDERSLRAALRGLATAGLISASTPDAPAGPLSVAVHPVVADVNRARLLTSESASLPVTGTAVVRSLRSAAAGLDPRRPADWPAYASLVPHAAEVLKWLAQHLDDETLAALLSVASTAVVALRRNGKLPTAEELARASVAAAGRLGEAHPALLSARHVHARALEALGRNRESERQFRDVLASQERVLGGRHPDTLATRAELGRVIAHSRYAEAELLQRGVLALQSEVLGDDHPDTLRTGHALAQTTVRLGRGAEAERLYARVLAGRRRVMGDDHPDTIKTRYALARAIDDEGRAAEAERLTREVLADQERAGLGLDHPEVLRARSNVALMVAHQGRSAEAGQMYQEVLPDLRRVLGDDHPITLYAELNLTDAIAAQDRLGEAEQRYRSLAARLQELLNPDHPITSMARHALAGVIARLDRPAEAEEIYREVLATRERVLGQNHPSTIATSRALEKAVAAQAKATDPHAPAVPTTP